MTFRLLKILASAIPTRTRKSCVRRGPVGESLYLQDPMPNMTGNAYPWKTQVGYKWPRIPPVSEAVGFMVWTTLKEISNRLKVVATIGDKTNLRLEKCQSNSQGWGGLRETYT